ncbi:hypothetical protein JCM13664_09290 [Methylothermus subterraneus]
MRLIVSTCGTSLWTNQAEKLRPLVVQHANAKDWEEIPPELRALVERAARALQEAGPEEQAKLSAELNGLWRYYQRRLDRSKDTHWLIATDTWLGESAAQAVGQVLENCGHIVEVRRIKDLRTNDVAEFRVAMAELIRMCAQEVRGYRERGYKVVFNLTGGFKSVQGFMQALAMLYADESFYVFEQTEELLRLPIELDALALAREHHKIFRRLAVGLPVCAGEVKTLPETLFVEIDGQVALPVWGEAVWKEAEREILGERVLEPVDKKLRFSENFSRSVQNLSADEYRSINQRLAELARHLHEPTYNPSHLDFKKLSVPHGPHRRWTHECDAWAAKRLFGYFDGEVFVVDALAEGLH